MYVYAYRSHPATVSHTQGTGRVLLPADLRPLKTGSLDRQGQSNNSYAAGNQCDPFKYIWCTIAQWLDT